jgi:hypothetical protein
MRFLLVTPRHTASAFEELSVGAVTVSAMKLTTSEDRWTNIQAHTGTHVKSAPWAVLLAVAALVGDKDITGSWATYQPNEPEGHTTWTEYIATAERLIHVQLEFDAQMYDLGEDNDEIGRRSVTAVIKEAWARRLSDVAQLRIGHCGERLPERAPHDGIPIGDISLSFNDGGKVHSGFDQQRMIYPQERERSDQFIAAVRAGANI